MSFLNVVDHGHNLRSCKTNPAHLRIIIDNFIKKLLKSYLQLIRLKKKKKLFIQKHYLQFLSI